MITFPGLPWFPLLDPAWPVCPAGLTTGESGGATAVAAVAADTAGAVLSNGFWPRTNGGPGTSAVVVMYAVVGCWVAWVVDGSKVVVAEVDGSAVVVLVVDGCAEIVTVGHVLPSPLLGGGIPRMQFSISLPSKWACTAPSDARLARTADSALEPSKRNFIGARSPAVYVSEVQAA
jgi:hypothetical protein